MEIDIATKKRPYSEDLATYLDKLLRQDYRQPKRSPSRPSWEHSTDALGLTGSEVSPPEFAPVEPPANPLPEKPLEAKPPKAAKTEVSRRPGRLRRPKRIKAAVKRKKKDAPKNVRQTVMAILVPVLAVTLLIIVRQPWNTPVPMATESTGESMTFDVADPVIEIAWEIPPQYVVNGRDPMASIAPLASSPEMPIARQTLVRRNLVIKGILYSEDRPATVIGTRLLHIGDEISDARIVNIERDFVEFEADGETWKQTVASEDATGDLEIR